MYRHTKKNIDYFLHHHVQPFKIPAGYKYNMELFGVQNGLQNRAASTNNDGQMGCNMG